MQLRHIKSVLPPQERIEGKFQKITAVAWAPNNSKLAVATADRYITLFDENGEQKDRFATKAADGGGKNYVIRALDFSPDSTRLAVAQSDKIVFVYKLGLKWGEKKTICNKFPMDAEVTTMIWPSSRPNEIVIGQADGLVKIGVVKKNKAVTIMDDSDSYVVSLAPSADGNSFVCGRLDGSIYRYNFPDADGQYGPSSAVLVQTEYVPYALAWGEHIVAAGNSSRIDFFSSQGGLVQTFDMGKETKMKEFCCATSNASGHNIVLGNFDSFYICAYDLVKESWREPTVVRVPNLYSVTAIRWKADGSRLVTGSLAGALDMYDACLRRQRYKGKFEFTYTSLTSVIIQNIETGARVSIQSQFGMEIQKIDIQADRFVIARTPETLIVADIASAKFSEISWNGGGKEKFYFDNPAACIIYNAGELTLLEYGSSEILGSCRTEFMSRHTISLVVAGVNSEEKQTSDADQTSMLPVTKKIAYLLDQQAIRILDLQTGITEATVNHDTKIDWLQLNYRGTKLIFRDKRKALHLYDIATQQRVTILSFCNFVQWVPQSDVLVAQNRRSLCVWYSIDNPDQVTTIAIKGDVEVVERANGHTDVVVDEGINQATYGLDESLIAFSTAVDNRLFDSAVSILEGLDPSAAGAEGMWRRLSKIAMQEGDFRIAERCAAALGDVARAEWLHKVNGIAEVQPGGYNNYVVRAKLAMLNKQFKRAEAIFLEQGRVDQAITMYRSLHKWDEAIAVAQARGSPELLQLRQDYFQYLITSHQEEVAGELKEQEGDLFAAIDLYLKSGFPAKAATLVIRNSITNDTALLERINQELVRKQQFEKAGEFLESLGSLEAAMDAYRRGHAYRKAVELARRSFPQHVVRLEEEWGDYLAAQKQMDAACNHYTEAGAWLKGINAAIEAKQWNKVKILEHLEPAVARPFYKRVAQHYEETKQYDVAERYFLQGGLPEDAVKMYTSAGLWEQAHKIAKTYMKPKEVTSLYVTQAQRLESKGKFSEAEKLYLTVNEPDLAITMYKKNRQYDQMLNLVSQYRKELLNETYRHLASQFAAEGNFKLAETHFLKAKEWTAAVNMYRERNLWDDALRVAQSAGGVAAVKQVAYGLATTGTTENMAALRDKGTGLADLAVDHAIELNDFSTGFRVAEFCAQHKLGDVHLQFAMSLEDEGRFEQAEAEFIKANKPKEAVEMYCHQRDWAAATRVAEAYEPGALADILTAQGHVAREQADYRGAETHFLAAKKPDLALKMYREAHMHDDALRLAKQYAPNLVRELQLEREQYITAGVPLADGGAVLGQGRELENRRQYSAAIDAYLKVTAELSQDSDLLQRQWERAVALAMEHVHERAGDVIAEVSRRLVGIKRFEAAASVCLQAQGYKQAIDAYIAGGLFDKAHGIAQRSAPQYLQYIEKAEEQHLIKNNNPDELQNLNPDAAIEMFANRGDWDKVYELAVRQGEPVVQHFASLHAKTLVQAGKYADALQVLSDRGVAISKGNYTLYKRIAHEVLATVPAVDGREGTRLEDKEAQTMLRLREMLYQVYTEVKDENDADAKEFEKLLFIAHCCHMRLTCKRNGLKVPAAHAAVSLLRYTADVPFDKVLYDAGRACQTAGINNMAFVFYNRFVDLTDIIAEEQNAADLDNSDFLNTDIPSPYDVPMPSKHNFPEDVREAVRDWVLEHAMSQEIDQNLSLRNCEQCGKKTYEANLTCHNCKHTHEPCCVTGYPVLRNTLVKCRNCQKPANKNDWNEYVGKLQTCPWCHNPQNPIY